METPVRTAQREDGGFYGVVLDGEPSFSIPEGPERLEAHVMVCAHMVECGTPGSRGDAGEAPAILRTVGYGGQACV